MPIEKKFTSKRGILLVDKKLFDDKALLATAIASSKRCYVDLQSFVPGEKDMNEGLEELKDAVQELQKAYIQKAKDRGEGVYKPVVVLMDKTKLDEKNQARSQDLNFHAIYAADDVGTILSPQTFEFHVNNWENSVLSARKDRQARKAASR